MMPYKDSEKNQACIKEYLENHRKEISAQKRTYRENHREEIVARRKEYYKTHRKEIEARNKKYHENHREKTAAYNKEWRKDNQKKMRAYYKKKRSTPEGKIINALRIRMSRVLHGNPKVATTLKLLGCSLEFFKIYIANKFKPGMTWDNHGQFGWHLDHIKPCVSFDLLDPEQQKKCFHYTNFQPLWWRDNLNKRVKDKKVA